nr:immunoglobulin light chain junction region [Macaca mulatta]
DYYCQVWDFTTRCWVF